MRYFQSAILVFIFYFMPFILNSCYDQPVDAISKPSVSITNPVMNSNVPDSTTIRVEINNINNIIRVELYIDHQNVAVLTKAPYNYFWSTGYYYYDGSQHIIEAKAYDDKGNIYTPPPSIVYVYRFMPSWLRAGLISNTKIELNWNDNCTYETNFEIEQAGQDSVFKKIATVDSNTITYTVNGNFQKGQPYLFRVRAKAGNTFSGYTNIATAIVVLKAPDIINVVYTSDTTATITWADSSDLETSFSIYDIINGSYHYGSIVPANTTSVILVDDFISGNSYGFVVAAMDGYSSSPSQVKYFQYIMEPPTNLSASGTDINKVQLTWSNSISMLTPVAIERKELGSNYQEIGTVSPGVSKFTDIHLDTSKIYYYRVKAYTRINSVYSNEIKVQYAPQLTDYKKMRAPSNIASFDISRDGSYIVMGGYTPTAIAIYLLDANNGNLIRTYWPHDSLHICDHIGISYDNTVIAGGGNANNVNLWNVNDASFRGVMNLGYYTSGLMFHPNKNILVTTAVNMSSLGIWNYETNTQIYNINADVSLLAMSKNGNLVAAAASNEVKIIDLNSGSIIKTLPGQSVTAAFCDDDKTLISCYLGSLKIWNLDNATNTEYIFQYDQIWDVEAIAGTNYIIFTDGGGFSIIDRGTGKTLSRFNTRDGYGNLKLLNDNSTIVSASWDNLYFRKLEMSWVTVSETIFRRK
jgi:WD40 repeat protein